MTTIRVDQPNTPPLDITTGNIAQDIRNFFTHNRSISTVSTIFEENTPSSLPARHPAYLAHLLELRRSLPHHEYLWRGLRIESCRHHIPITPADPDAPWYWETKHDLNQGDWYNVLKYCYGDPRFVIREYQPNTLLRRLNPNFRFTEDIRHYDPTLRFNTSIHWYPNSTALDPTNDLHVIDEGSISRAWIITIAINNYYLVGTEKYHSLIPSLLLRFENGHFRNTKNWLKGSEFPPLSHTPFIRTRKLQKPIRYFY